MKYFTLFLTVLLLSVPVKAQNDITPQHPRDIYLYGEVNDSIADNIAFFISALNSEDNQALITLHITSNGGSGDAMFKIVDAMKLSKAPVKTVCEGHCYSAGAVVLASGDVREAWPHAEIMVHEGYFSGTDGRLPEQEEHLRYVRDYTARVDELMRVNTGLSLKEVQKMMSWDHFMTPEEAKKYGIIDAITK